MAGYSKIYCIGTPGGFQGADGINPILLQIWVGEGNRQWLEGHAFDAAIRPLGRIQVVIPEGPNHPNALLDACLAFFPDHFRECRSLAAVHRELAQERTLDLSSSPLPAQWAALREEARPLFRQLFIMEAELQPVAHSGHA